MSYLPTSDSEALQPGLVFAVTFIVCVICAAILMALIPDSYWTAWRDLTMLATKGVGALCGLAITSRADILTVNGFAMRIIRQCTAVDYLAILSAAMLLYTRHSLSYRLFGLAVAVPVVIFANACRLVISGLVGSYSRSAFDVAHDYLWVIGFALLVFAIWALWVNGRFLVSRSAAWRVGQVALGSLAGYAVLLFFHDAYGDLMAGASSLLYRLLNDDPLAHIVREGDLMVYHRPGAVFNLENMLEQVNVAIYLGLMVPLQRRGDWGTLGRTMLGLLFIVLMGAVFIALACAKAVTAGMEGLIGFQCLESIVRLALPLSIYWIMSSERKTDSPAPSPDSAAPRPGGKAKRGEGAA